MLEEKANLSLSDVLLAVQNWPVNERIKLLQKVAESLTTESSSLFIESKSQKDINTLLQAFWAELPPHLPQLTDEELDDMKLQWRLEKYG